ncbi:MAG: BlaI/MecI/CopY family transcriptional regulator [Bacteroidales bacterium]|nr:BlaI/MecI/CopY family transcriptional regulator [Bacteroidales bacterium]
MKKDRQYQPTESELEILQVLWKKGSGTVREVHEVLEAQKETGYTTTLKTMQIMTEKGLLSRDTRHRTHIYFPELSREDCQQHFLNKMLDGLFDGSAGRLVMGALDNKKINREELDAIREYLKQFEHPSS